MTHDLPRLPTHTGDAAWPTLDRHVTATRPYEGVKDLDEQVAVAARNRQAAAQRAMLLALGSAAPKGALLGLVAFGIVYGFASSILSWWRETGLMLPSLDDTSGWLSLVHVRPTLSDWISAVPWLATVVVGALLSMRFRLQTGIVMFALGCIALGVLAIPHHLIAFLVFLVVGALLRCLIEVIP